MLIVETLLSDLYDLGYPKEIKEFNYQKNMLMFDSAVWDIETGAVLRLDYEKSICEAYFGFIRMPFQQIMRTYGTKALFRHKPFPKALR